MGDIDRKYVGQLNAEFLTSEVDVHGNTVVQKGDLVFLDRVDGLRKSDRIANPGSSTADNYGYPFSLLSCATNTLDANKLLAKRHFLGVAAGYSDSGITEKIAVYYRGHFQLPLKHARRVKVGYDVIPAGSGVTLYNQRVAVESGASNYRIGKAVNSGKFKANVITMILSRVVRSDPEVD